MKIENCNETVLQTKFVVKYEQKPLASKSVNYSYSKKVWRCYDSIEHKSSITKAHNHQTKTPHRVNTGMIETIKNNPEEII